MPGIIVNNGEKVALEYLTNKVATTRDLVLRLFRSNTTPTEATVAGDLTEANFTGYAPITLAGASWIVAGTTPTLATFPQRTFTSTADQTAQAIYGYYLTRATDGDLVAVERFADGPYSITNNGDSLRLTPTITAANVV